MHVFPWRIKWQKLVFSGMKRCIHTFMGIQVMSCFVVPNYILDRGAGLLMCNYHTYFACMLSDVLATYMNFYCKLFKITLFIFLSMFFIFSFHAGCVRITKEDYSRISTQQQSSNKIVTTTGSTLCHRKHSSKILCDYRICT